VQEALEWFQDRPCARQGRWLGTPFPFDTSYTIEAISDSTLYPIYYLVSKYVNEGKLKPQHLTLEFFDFVYLDKGDAKAVAEKTGVEQSLLIEIQKDVQYWYPLDINLGGKEHRRVHFPPFMMNHVAILPQKYWPKGIFVNEWVMQAKGEKLSKSKGGAQPIPDVAKKYSVDAMRLFYANIGSPFSDIYFSEADVINYKQRIEKIYNLVKKLKQTSATYPSSADELLQSRINRSIKKATDFMESLDVKRTSDIIYMEMYKAFQSYSGNNKGILIPLLKTWAKMLTVFTPHIAEEIWNILGEKEIVSLQEYDWNALYISI
jgi:leucyl-tRNA synthetase